MCLVTKSKTFGFIMKSNLEVNSACSWASQGPVMKAWSITVRPRGSVRDNSRDSNEATHGRSGRFCLNTQYLCPMFREDYGGVTGCAQKREVTQMAQHVKSVIQGLGVSLIARWFKGVLVSCFKTSLVLKLNPHSRSRVRPSASRCIEIDLRINTKNVPAMEQPNNYAMSSEYTRSMARDVQGDMR